MTANRSYTFAISLSVLDHLGRNLYRSFATILGEAISNSWDADANNVWLYIDKQKGSFFIKDDGDGMDAGDFQNKFLKIGYSKRKGGQSHSRKGRPYIGRKGIGKLALLSCAQRIAVISRVSGGDYVGGVIDNSGLDDAITSDLTPDKYPLEEVDMSIFGELVEDHEKGTIIYFENMKEGIRNSLDYLRKLIALYFRFSLVDDSFKIFVDDERITLDDLKDLTEDTEFLWNINGLDDPYVKKSLKYDKNNRKTDVNLLEPAKLITVKGDVKGFIASVRMPRDLKVMATEERIGVDLFVNGRLREKDILRHIPSARIPESYLYGQIHLNDLDDSVDRFSTSREGVVPNDEKFEGLLKNLGVVLNVIFSDWDDWRRKHHKAGDLENPSIPVRERKAEELFNEVSREYEIREDPRHPGRKEKVDSWVDELTEDARYNFPSYAECFVSENLVRKHIKEKKLRLSKEARKQVSEMKKKETANKNRGNISIEIRKTPIDTSYLSMDDLANMVDKRDPIKEACLARDANEYKPIRDAVAHTALLTDPAKNKLTTIFANIKERVRTLLSGA
ncbi:MAG: ATP-binding protein [Thaumarchaeota archaeon]|nr:ATP-binding protein [Nitrososphaerota archaeon]